MLSIKKEKKYRTKHSFSGQVLLILFFLLYAPSAFAESPGNPLPPPDTLKSSTLRYPLESKYNYPYSTSGIVSPLMLPPPDNIEQKVVYDPETNSYILSEKIGQINYRPPSSMSFEDYNKYQSQQIKSTYWYERAKEESGAGPSFLKGLHLGNESVDKLFGGEGITITPQGSAELRFGYSITNNENPSIPVRNQRNGSFIFKEKIMMNVTGNIGDKMEVGLNYNTEATFDFENKTKLEYSGKEDEIIKKIEAGDVSFSLPGNLITGSQSLFGIKTELQFGRLSVATVFSHQRSESSSINVQGGAQQTEFEIDIDLYDINRHFFLSHFFRDNYDRWMKNLPYIESQLNIDEIEVWVVNKQNNFTESRDIVAVMDLGEGYGPQGVLNYQANGGLSVNTFDYNQPASNSLNNLYASLAGRDAIRQLKQTDIVFAQINTGLYTYAQGRDYISLENARPLSTREYTVNKELGFISLNSPLRNDEVLAVAFTYTYKGKKYTVGELTNYIKAPDALIVKLLKGTTQTPKYKNWDLMMKNIYSIGAYQVSRDGFVLDIMYRNDKTGVFTNYLTEEESAIHEGIYKQTLLKILRLDNLDYRNEAFPDGKFDFVEGITINSKNGRIMFPVVEPFGSHLYDTISNYMGVTKEEWQKVAQKYVFQELYDSTQTKAQQVAEKNKFVLKGYYQSSSSSDIMLNAMNVPRGSVIVMAGGRELQENVDYTVDYTLGRVKIINTGLIESGTPIQVKLESNSMFNMQTKTLIGTHLDYKFSENFNFGGTVMRLTERPLTSKVNIGDEPISNTIWGLNTSYRTESQLLTSIIDKIPLIETKELSSLTFDGEFAQLVPGQSKMISKSGIAYVDDFEGAQTKIELKNAFSWVLCSPPKDSRAGSFYLSAEDGLASGYGRAKLSWYSIDPIFYGNYKPANLNTGSHYVRRVEQKELFPFKDEDIIGLPTPIRTLNLNYFPTERGPYNFDPSASDDGQLPFPEDRWAGIMREIIMSDFETSNIEFIEFWLMDPFVEQPSSTGGDLYFHIGEISEDILRDAQKSFENGLPTSEVIENIDTTIWGFVPTGKAIVTGFAGDAVEREYQDIGLDGLNDEKESSFFLDFADFDDPSADDFEYYLGSDHDNAQHNIIQRYKNYNGLEGNSPSPSDNSNVSEAYKTTPDIEDINDDNTLNTSETYYQYKISLRPEDFVVGENFIIDQIEGEENDGKVPVMWYQFRIPIDEFESKIGEIEDFKSIRFMRIMLNGFADTTILRFATLDLIRGEWRRYKQDLYTSSPTIAQQYDETSFEVSSVNIEENGNKTPVNYILPPGIDRVQDPSQPQIKQLNEQSLMVKVYNLEDNDARAVYKTTQLDLRQYKNLKMFIHAENLPNVPEDELQDYDLTAFIRLGSDYLNNYYEFEIPLKRTPYGTYNQNDPDDPYIVWPLENTMILELQKLVDLKIERNEAMENDPTGLINTQSIYVKNDEKLGDENSIYNKLKIKGNPNLSNIRQIMLGIRNPGDDESLTKNDGEPKTAEIWFNELRLTDFDNEGGWAANGQFQAKLADLGIVSFAGATSKPGFGSIEQTVEQRQQEEINQVDVSSNLELGKFFPEKAKVTVPLYMAYSNTTINPEYYPKDPDIKLADAIAMAKTDEEKQAIKDYSRDITERKSINLTNVRWNKQFEKVKLASPGNLSATVGYSETNMSDYSVDYNRLRKYGANLNYNYNNRPQTITPFSKWKAVRKPAFRIVRDINFNYAPSSFSFSTKFDRDYQTMKLRNLYDDADVIIDSTTSKGFYWDRNYTLRWDFTRSLKFNYNASNHALIGEPTGASDWFEPSNEEWKDSVWTSIVTGGRNLQFNQKFGLEYTLPLNKIPILNWTNIRASYDGTYTWTRGAELADKTAGVPGNNIKNSNSVKLNGNFNLDNLYSKVGYFKKLDSKYSKKGKKNQDVDYKTVEYSKRTFLKKDSPKNIIHKLGTEKIEVKAIDDQGKEVKIAYMVESENKVSVESEEDLTGITIIVTGRVEKGPNPFVFIGENAIRTVLGFKNINLVYNRTESTMLPGYIPTTDIIGLNQSDYYGAPGIPFILGWQDEDILYTARNNEWLTQYEYFSQPTIFAVNESFNFRSSYEPFDGLRIDFSGLRTHSHNTEQNYYPMMENSRDSITNKYRGGTFSISAITLFTAFENFSKDNNWSSEAYEKLKSNRKIIAGRLNRLKTEEIKDYHDGLAHSRYDKYYADGYNESSSEVLMYSFLSAYTGKSPWNMALEQFPWSVAPNWKVTFDGLSDLDFVQKFVKNLTLTHSYKSLYNINAYTTNVNYYESEQEGLFTGKDARGLVRDIQSNMLALYQPNSISINEQLNPLISFDMTWHNSLLTKFEISKSRMISLSMSNNQLTETRNNDLVFGAGYKFKDVPLNITTGGGSRTIKSDLNIRFDLSVRDNTTILRSLADYSDDITTGARRFAVDMTADYVLSQRVNMQVYIRRDVNDPYVSNYYKNSETEFGFSLRMSL